MQIILSKSAFFLVKKDFNECGYDYDLIIIKSRLRKLECPHCHRQLACSGYYLRTIITAKGKKIIRIPRLQCGNRECVYKITRHLKTPPIIKPIPYFIRKFCQHLLINILVLALVKAPNPYLSKVLFKYLELGEKGYSEPLSMYALKVIRYDKLLNKDKSNVLLVDAVIDRILEEPIIITLNGDSRRRHKNKTEVINAQIAITNKDESKND